MKNILLIIGFAFLGATANGQVTEWFQIATGTTKKLNTIDFPSSSVGFIGGNDSILLKTIDGGLNWTEVNYSGVTYYPGGEHIINLDFVSENIGFMTVGPYSGSFKTIDGGYTWTAITGLNMCYNQGMYFFDEQNGFIAGSGCFQGELIDKLVGGVWSSSTVNTSTWNAQNIIVDIDFLDANYGLAASKSGYVLRTTDGGVNWDTIPTPSDPQNPLTSILIVNSNLAYAGYEALNIGFGLYISVDGGLTWQDDMNSATFLYPDFYALHQSGNGTIYAGANSAGMTSGYIFESPGDIVTWSYNQVDQKINAIASYNDSIVFAVGDSGYVVINKNPATLGITTLDFNNSQLELFPNPSNSILNLKLSKEFENEIEFITIFNLEGKKVYTQKDLISIDISNLSNGTYILELTGKSNSIKKRFIKN